MASIRKRNGSYQITVSCGYDIRGKKLLETTTFTPDPCLTPKKQEKAVQDFAMEFEAKVRNGILLSGRKITLQEYAARWIDEYAKLNLQPGTVAKYQEELDNKILPSLGHYKLSELKPHIVNAFFVSLSKDGARKDGRPGGYSKGSIMKTRNVLSSILRTAVQWEIIDSNPCDKVQMQKMDVAEKVSFFTPEQTIRFLEYIEQPYTVQVRGHKRVDDTGKPYQVGDYTLSRYIPEQIRLLFNLAIYAGLRKGELLALEWDDIDFSQDTIRVTKSVAVANKEQVIKRPKTRTSHRVVTIPHFLTERLQALKEQREEFIAQVGDFWQGGQWVFIQENGRMMNYSTPYQAFHDVVVRYNKGKPPQEQLPQIPFHGLRHTSATLLIANHQDLKTVSKRLGHAQTSTTMNIYAHALQQGDRQASNALETMLKPKQALGGDA